jgi:hypothetical protein
MSKAFKTVRRAGLLALVAGALGLGFTAQANAATYYNVVNVKTGLALSATGSSVTLKTPNPNDEHQQFKRIWLQNGFNSTSSSLQRRYSGCLYAEQANGPVSLGSCLQDPSDKRNRWSKVYNWDTSIGGVGLHNDGVSQTMLGFCFFGCAAMMQPYSISGELRQYSTWDLRPVATGL